MSTVQARRRSAGRTTSPLEAGEVRLARAFSRLMGTSDWRLALWDGRTVGPETGLFTISLRSPRALDWLLGALPDRAFGRAFVEGDVEVEPITPFLDLVGGRRRLQLLAAWPDVVRTGLSMGARPMLRPVPDAEARLRGRRHSRERDSAAVRHHYDLPVEFYELWLDPTLTYSCAYFQDAADSVATAQRAKLDLVCRKLRLRPGETLLDVGCGWGSLLHHAAANFGVSATGISLSPRQVERARLTAGRLGCADRVDARLADYRDPFPTRFDAVASIGMVEHVGERRMDEYVASLHRALRPGGRLLLHGITAPPDSEPMRGSFVDAFHFPDSEVPEVGRLITRLQRAGFEVRDVENLREHYALTLDAWCDAMDRRMDEMVAIAGPERTRVWRLGMRGSALAFRRCRRSLHQILAVRPEASGDARLPLTRADWYTTRAGEAPVQG